MLTIFLSLLVGCGGDAGVNGGRLVVYAQEAKPNGVTLSDATVTVRNHVDDVSGDSTALVSRQLTASNGPGDAYVFEGLPPDKYTVTVERYGYQNPQASSISNQGTSTTGSSTTASSPKRATTLGVEKEIFVQDGGDYDITVYLEKTPLNDTGIVQGKVREKTTDGSTGDPIANVTVSIVAGSAGYTDITASNGDYTISDIPVSGSPYTIYAYPPDPEWQVFSDQVLVATSSDSPTVFNMELTPTSSATSGDTSEVGSLTYSISYYKEGPTDSDYGSGNNGSGPGASHRVYYDLSKAGVNFSAIATNISTGIAYSISGNNGTFSFTGLPAGDYNVKIYPDLASGGHTSPTITVNAGQTTGKAEEVELADEYAGRVRLHLNGSSNLPDGTAGGSYEFATGIAGTVYTIQEDNITVDSSGVNPTLIEYYPVPWDTYTPSESQTYDSLEVQSVGPAIINVSNPIGDIWTVFSGKK